MFCCLKFFSMSIACSTKIAKQILQHMASPPLHVWVLHYSPKALGSTRELCFLHKVSMRREWVILGDFFFFLYFSSTLHIWCFFCQFLWVILVQLGRSAVRWRCPGKTERQHNTKTPNMPSLWETYAATTVIKWFVLAWSIFLKLV